MDYLTRNQYCNSLKRANERCFGMLEAYLEEKGDDYRPELADKWFAENKETFSKTFISHFRMALLRLRDVYECGEVLPIHDTRHLMSYSALTEEFRQDLEEFLQSLGEMYSPKTVDNYKHLCSRFLIFVQREEMRTIEEITPQLIADFYEQDIHAGKNGKHHVNTAVSAMMIYFYEKNRVSYGSSIILHYLSHGRNTGCYWNDVSDDAHKRISALMESESTVPLDVLCGYKEMMYRFHRENGYSKSMLSAYNRAAELMMLFLEMNGYGYNPSVAEIWYHQTSVYFRKEADTIRRALCMIADIHRTSEIRPGSVYRRRQSAFEALPDWCYGPASEYVALKTKEGWEKSTLDMIRSSISRFCRYLDDIGIRAFVNLTSSHVRQFNIQDRHRTPQGKNAYNVRIRKFLIYLGEHGYLDNPMLFVALTCISAPKETIVVILSEEEMSELKRQLNDEDSSRLSLRKKAMLLLGLKMGMRASDIVNLKIDDIDWDTASIKFVQKKTSVEVNLPMPTEVGNALFRYITQERHQKPIRDIFLCERAPHIPVGRAACSKALDTALPDRDAPGSGFHVTRKTYATNLLRQGVGAGTVATALGQVGTASVSRYLSLDAERMRMCPLSLDGFQIGGWDNGR